MRWIDVCGVDDIDEEDVIRFDYNHKTYAVFRTAGDEFYASDGLCTHEQVHLADGLVIDYIIECPKHQGRFDIRDGKAKSAPVCVDLRTHLVKVEADRVFIGLSD